VTNNKIVIKFLIKFFGVYLLLFVLYSFYLNGTQERVGILSCAPITTAVGHQTIQLLEFMNYNASVKQNKDELSMNLKVNDRIVARVVEGCNAISIIILFIAFIIAMHGKFMPTALYVLFGSLIIYIANIFRIAFISLALFKYPGQQYILHDLVFPALIYGLTILLWFIWVKFFYKID